MLVTAREAARILAPLGLARETLRRVLACGLAGEGIRTTGALLYDDAAVRALRQRPVLGEWPPTKEEAERPIPPPACDGVFVARVGPRKPDPGTRREWKGVDRSAPWQEQADGVRMWFTISPWVRARLCLRAQDEGPIPFIATWSTYVRTTRPRRPGAAR